MMGKKEKIWLIRIEMLQLLLSIFWALWILIWKPKISLMWKLNRTTVGLGKLADQKILQTKGGNQTKGEN